MKMYLRIFTPKLTATIINTVGTIAMLKWKEKINMVNNQTIIGEK